VNDGHNKAASKIGVFFDNRAESYDAVHLTHIGGIDSKKQAAQYIPQKTEKLLDLGAGTGLELEFIFDRLPDIQIDCVDLSEKMLERLEAKYTGKRVNIFKRDYLQFDYKEDYYDCVLSVMSFHHLQKVEKKKLYKLIFGTLKDGGVFLLGDYIAKDKQEEERCLKEYRKAAKENKDEEFHFDTPTCLDTDRELLQAAGFTDISIPWRVKSNALILAYKAVSAKK
jgi:tRNA (cmo5U34)-methyltransferase